MSMSFLRYKAVRKGGVIVRKTTRNKDSEDLDARAREDGTRGPVAELSGIAADSDPLAE
jgi:hypothetical protein